MNRTTWAPAFDDRFPTQPIRVGLVPDHRRTPAPHREPPPPRRHHRAPARTARSTRATILIAVAVVAAVIGYPSWASSSATPDSRGGPAAAARQAEAAPRHPAPRDPARAAGKADGVVPEGVTVFEDEFPAVAELDPALLGALRRAAKVAADDGITFYVNSGWRSREYQDQLLRDAVSEYGSREEAARWVATADTSRHVSGDAVDIGRPDAAAWLSEHGAAFGLCRIYRNEPWHYELRPAAVDRGCPRTYADPTHDPRMQK